MTKRIRKKKKK